MRHDGGDSKTDTDSSHGDIKAQLAEKGLIPGYQSIAHSQQGRDPSRDKAHCQIDSYCRDSKRRTPGVLVKNASRLKMIFYDVSFNNLGEILLQNYSTNHLVIQLINPILIRRNEEVPG